MKFDKTKKIDNFYRNRNKFHSYLKPQMCTQAVPSTAKHLKFTFINLNRKSYTHLFLPFLAGAPPTMRVFATLEYPHPSSGVNKRPLMSAIFLSPYQNRFE